MKEIEVVPHNFEWRDEFETEAKQIAAALGENIVSVYHIGSTAIPNIYAKPIIDLLVEVKDISVVDEQNSAMESLGYEVMGEFGIVGRRYFRKDNQHGIRTHQIHTFVSSSPEVERHLAFRDYLIAHAEEAQSYSDLKRRLIEKNSQNMDEYMDGKDDFIKKVDQKAEQWRKSQTIDS